MRERETERGQQQLQPMRVYEIVQLSMRGMSHIPCDVHRRIVVVSCWTGLEEERQSHHSKRERWQRMLQQRQQMDHDDLHVSVWRHCSYLIATMIHHDHPNNRIHPVQVSPDTPCSSFDPPVLLPLHSSGWSPPN